MKKLLLFFALISFAILANAQSTTTGGSTSNSTYKDFKVDLDLGYAIPSSGNGTKAGATFTIEPHYRLCDAFAIGFRFEGAAIGYENTIAGKSKVKVSLLTSYCVTGDYYFENGGFRPFAGAGAGDFSLRAVAGSKSSPSVSSGSSRFGVFPRVGFEAGHFRFSAAYDIVGNNSDYLAFTIGFFLGGGKK